MRVKDLLKALGECDPEAIVTTSTEESDHQEVQAVEKESTYLWRYDNVMSVVRIY